MIKINAAEYALMKQYIKEHCGIFLEAGKEYLIESRLTDLLMENGCTSFNELYEKARSDTTGKLKDRVVDAMTTNETFWFRDDSTWEYIREVAVPGLVEKAAQGKTARIWSAAASTGQEAYSLMILIHEAARKRGRPDLLDRIEIIGTDISTSALFLARSGRYAELAMNRGMPLDKRAAYFEQKGKVWEISPDLKKRVSFRPFNLMNSFAGLGTFDLILCRYVIIYFDNEFKKTLFSKMAAVMEKKAVFLLGATESLRGFSNDFNITYYKNAVINEKL